MSISLRLCVVVGKCGACVSKGDCMRWRSHHLDLVEVEAAGLDRVDGLEPAVPVLERRVLHAVHVRLHAHSSRT